MAASELRPLPLNSPSPSPQEEALLGRRELRQNQNKAQQAGSGRVLGSRLGAAGWKQPSLGWVGRQAGRQGPSSGPLTSGEAWNLLLQLPQLWSQDSFPGPPDGETESSMIHLTSTCLAQPRGPTKLPPWTSGFQFHLVGALPCSHTLHCSPWPSVQHFRPTRRLLLSHAWVVSSDNNAPPTCLWESAWTKPLLL